MLQLPPTENNFSGKENCIATHRGNCWISQANCTWLQKHREDCVGCYSTFSEMPSFFSFFLLLFASSIYGLHASKYGPAWWLLVVSFASDSDWMPLFDIRWWNLHWSALVRLVGKWENFPIGSRGSKWKAGLVLKVRSYQFYWNLVGIEKGV